MANVVFKSYSIQVKEQLAGNVLRALLALGTEAVGMIVRNMQKGYGKPIRKTGNLMGDVHYAVHEESKSVDVGNSLEYAVHVHEGTSRMKGRAYIRDALNNEKNREKLQKIAAAYLKEGFE